MLKHVFKFANSFQEQLFTKVEMELFICLANCRFSSGVSLHSYFSSKLLLLHKKTVSHVINSRALTYEKPCINKAIHALLMHGYATFNMIVPGPQICCRYEMCTARP